ncbi:uncharacterized protein LOC110227541 isoform X2 [Arabidopsis lyrata subsp. lyrata]|uniref:uncharacterized protein LOC110227541 isoform X2 n=1 Tax=Arabidopsis lyrata subsp. lyrata TaxID=81972 RepID=UPI000A29DE19|nr:uncharacterized protein LOC110227541 isoform X2 [Arabidopsis lyrata subsp. lyrata]|eukprot:XP_020877679.1 uncharacterized protein LOC110227541 isoform X2 [Arabidopsis lyrata subsp. lyrata]
MSSDATFQVYHSGKFSVSSSGVVTYDGGEIHKLESQPESMLENLVDSLKLSLSGHRIWFKLPFESLSDLKIMCNGTDGIEKMCAAANYTKNVDIFLEKNMEQECDINGNRAADGKGDENRANGEANDNGDRFDADEENVGCGEEEEVYNSEGTPPHSDCEGERQYIRCRKGSGELRISQVFDSIAEFKEAVVDYALKEGVNVKFTRWGSEKCEVKCSLGGTCMFKIYCSLDRTIGKYQIKTFHDEHSCIPDGYSKVLKDGVIAKLFLDDIRKNPLMKPKELQERVEERYHLTVSNDQCRKAKAKALSIIQDEQDEEFSRIKDYRLALKEANPGSTVEVGTVTTDDGIEKFDRFYVCLAPLRKMWLADCRPIIGIDGCFLKNNVKGQLLAAIGRDANNQFYSVAWCIVPIENADSWIWFIRVY